MKTATKTTRNIVRSGTRSIARVIAVTVLFTGSIAAGQPAAAQATCGARGEVVAALAKQHGETPVAVGLSSDGRAIEVFASATGTTFTIVMTTVEGVSCVAGDGEAWQRLPKVVLGRAS